MSVSLDTGTSQFTRAMAPLFEWTDIRVYTYECFYLRTVLYCTYTFVLRNCMTVQPILHSVRACTGK